MPNQAKFPQPLLKAGITVHGFKVLRVETLPAIRLTAYEMEHETTGAKVLHLHSLDRENLYAIGFRTPPSDSTGLPHILEHSVLAGSEKYPLKDVFKELMRSTLQTFINAFTYPDKTIYPVASQIRADFFNLARVYTDLVLRPRLLPETFLQEGHHLEFVVPDNISSRLTISGIVYNEMKGAYSSPDSLMYKAIQENLYPDSVYAFDSGGDPDVIPSLTYEQFCRFHRTYYSPSNARFFIYGDIPTVEHLIFLEGMLKDFKRVRVNSAIKNQKHLNKPRIVHNTYPVAKGESLDRKTSVNMAWMLSENTDYENSLVLEIISGLLVGSSASPLRKALIDSGLGEDLTPVSGIESDLKQLMFAVGLRNMDSADVLKIEKLIFDTLKNIISTGYDNDLVEGILHQIEFHGKEIVRGSYPYGIALMSNVFQTWLYDGDPLIGLDFPLAIERIRKLWADDPELFQKMTKKWLLTNKHRLLAIMDPDPDFTGKKDKDYSKKMAGLRTSFTRAELKKINERAQELKKFQSAPDSAAAAATIPKLKIEDIPRSVETIPTKEVMMGGVPALTHNIFTNGIAYIDLVFDIAHIPEELQPYLPLAGKIISGMGAAGFSYDEMAKRIALNMGGFGYDLEAGFTADARHSWQKMIFSCKALYRNIPEALNIVSDILCAGDLSNEARMQDLIAERKNNLQSAVVPSGHIFARRAAAAALTLPAYRDELWNGRRQLQFVQQT
jgi:presequence protease